MVKYPTLQNALFHEHVFEDSLPNSGNSTGRLQLRSFFKSRPCGLELHSNCSEERLLPVSRGHHRGLVLETTHFFSFYLSALIEILKVPFLIDIWGSQTVFLMVSLTHSELKVPTAKTSMYIPRTRMITVSSHLSSRTLTMPWFSFLSSPTHTTSPQTQESKNTLTKHNLLPPKSISTKARCSDHSS